MKVGNSWLLCPGLPPIKAESLAASHQGPPGPGHTGSKRVAGRKLEVLLMKLISLVNHQVFDTNVRPTAGMWGLGFPPGDQTCAGGPPGKSQV